MHSFRDTYAAHIAARKWFAILPAATFPVTFFVDAPFGRFALKERSIFQVDGKPHISYPSTSDSLYRLFVRAEPEASIALMGFRVAACSF